MHQNPEQTNWKQNEFEKWKTYINTTLKNWDIKTLEPRHTLTHTQPDTQKKIDTQTISNTNTYTDTHTHTLTQKKTDPQINSNTKTHTDTP